MKIKRLLITPLLLFAATVATYADGTKEDPEVQYKYQFGLTCHIKLMKGLKLNLEPEFRFNDGYDKLLLNGGIDYKTFGCIYWGATYRMEVDRVESSSSSSSSYGLYNNKDYESNVYHRYSFDVTYKEKYGRFTPSFRVKYSNFADEDIDDKAFLRYRAKVEYNIRKCKFTPVAAIEAYQDLNLNMLYKMRYSTGFEIKTGKDSALSVDYKFDFFTLKYKNANIFSVGYKFKL